MEFSMVDNIVACTNSIDHDRFGPDIRQPDSNSTAEGSLPGPISRFSVEPGQGSKRSRLRLLLVLIAIYVSILETVLIPPC